MLEDFGKFKNPSLFPSGINRARRVGAVGATVVVRHSGGVEEARGGTGTIFHLSELCCWAIVKSCSLALNLLKYIARTSLLKELYYST